MLRRWSYSLFEKNCPLTSERDASGINAAVRAVVRKSIYLGLVEVVGISRGFWGLVNRKFFSMQASSVADIMGAMAVYCIMEKLSGGAICLYQGRLKFIDMREIFSSERKFNDDIYELAQILSI